MDRDTPIHIPQIIPQVAGILVVLVVSVIVFNEVVSVMQDSYNVSNDYSWESNNEDDFHEYINRDSPLKKELPPPQDMNQYETEEIDYDAILDDLGQEIMEKYEVNMTSDYDESLGDLLGGV